MTDNYLAQLVRELQIANQQNAALIQKLASQGGANPFGYPPRASRGAEHGVGYSGPSTLVRPGDKTQILNIAIADIVPNGYYGMASVHISAEDVDVSTSEAAKNAKLVAHVHYQSGASGGDFDIDLTRGHIFAVGATSAINIECELVSIDGADDPAITFATKKVETTVTWGTSVNPKEAIMTTDTVHIIAGGGASAFLPIPRQARSMIAQGDVSTGFPSLVAVFTNSNVGPRILHTQTNPNANGTIISQGMEFVSFVNPTVSMDVFGVFELWT